jgi:hypothetical protein
MRARQLIWTPERGWSEPLISAGNGRVGLLLAFGSARALEDSALIDSVLATHPESLLIGCTTAGEIAGTRLFDDSLVLTSVVLEHTRVRGAEVALSGKDDSYDAGRAIAAALAGDELRHVFVLSDGLMVNGSRLAEGLREVLPSHVAATGGLAGDDDRFGRTLVRLGKSVGEGRVAAIGFYGTKLAIGWGSIGGWDPYGPDRRVTRSKSNTLYELDGEPALDLYKRYLGPEAEHLPSSGLLFPLRVRITTGEGTTELVRTILSVDETARSLTFAGDIPEGSNARLMKANFDRLIDGAASAAQNTRDHLARGRHELSILISCVGRRLVLKQRTEEELEAVEELLGEKSIYAGFYSYGELSPAVSGLGCELHNQTMTITAFSEAPE